jgi:hypothetical protein
MEYKHAKKPTQKDKGLTNQNGNKWRKSGQYL